MKQTTTLRKRKSRSTSGGFSPFLYDVEELVRDLGIDITKSEEDEIRGRCPGHVSRTGHEDRNPSWSINRHTGAHHCWSCGYSGYLPALVCEVLDIDLWKAFKWLRSHGVNLEALQKLREEQPEVRNDFELSEEILTRFVEAPNWALKERSINRESCFHYNIRWDQKTRGWIFPIYLPDGSFVGYQLKAKKFVRNLPKDMGVKKSKTLFGLKQFPEGEPLILVEAPIDVPRFYTAGFNNSCASFGAHLSETQIQLILGVTDKLIIALDNPKVDRAGWLAAKALKKTVSKRIRTYFFNYAQSKVKDPGEMIDDEIRYGILNATNSAFVKL